MAAGTFEARYPGGCEICPARIEPGDEVMYAVGSGLMHAVCPEQIEERRGAICQRCFMEMPVVGECPTC